jgi:hypothetical protein
MKDYILLKVKQCIFIETELVYCLGWVVMRLPIPPLATILSARIQILSTLLLRKINLILIS